MALTINQTTDSNTLAGALNGQGVSINSATVQNGASVQFGTYTGFNNPPVTFSDGIVLSNGNVNNVSGPSSPDNSPSTDTGAAGTPEYNSYVAANATGVSTGKDVAALNVNFDLAGPSQVAFDFVFGSVEYPEYVNSYTDPFVAFLDGTDASNQIIFDKDGNIVQVGNSFSNLLTKTDTNTAFGDPHALLTSLTTRTAELSAGSHSLLFELGDANDHVLDSAAFISNLRTSSGDIGTGGSGESVPEPGTLAMMALGLLLIGAGGIRRRYF